METRENGTKTKTSPKRLRSIFALNNLLVMAATQGLAATVNSLGQGTLEAASPMPVEVVRTLPAQMTTAANVKTAALDVKTALSSKLLMPLT